MGFKAEICLKLRWFFFILSNNERFQTREYKLKYQFKAILLPGKRQVEAKCFYFLILLQTLLISLDSNPVSLFYGWSSVGRSHPKNWSNTNPLSDYESIDWTLEALLMLLKKSPSSKMSTSMSAIMHTLRSASTTAASSSSSSVCLWEWRSPSVASD